MDYEKISELLLKGIQSVWSFHSWTCEDTYDLVKHFSFFAGLNKNEEFLLRANLISTIVVLMGRTKGSDLADNLEKTLLPREDWCEQIYNQSKWAIMKAISYAVSEFSTTLYRATHPDE